MTVLEELRDFIEFLYEHGFGEDVELYEKCEAEIVRLGGVVEEAVELLNAFDIYESTPPSAYNNTSFCTRVRKFLAEQGVEFA